MQSKRFPRYLLVVALAGVLAFGTIGCFESSTDPDDSDSNDAFNEIVVLDIGVPSAVLQTKATLDGAIEAAGGFTGVRDYSWDADEQAYVDDLSHEEGDAVFTGTAWVQYLDGTTPVQDIGSADSVHFIYDLTVVTTTDTWSATANYDSDLVISGMGTGTLTGNGSGGFSYELALNGISSSQLYVATWETVGPDHITIPEGGGCPTGEIVFTMAPYTMSIIADGSSTASYTVYDADDAPVENGAGTFEFNCED